MAKIGFIGMGNMGHAIINGLLKKYPAKDMTFTCKRKEHAGEIEKDTGVIPAADNKACAAGSDVLILAVKPQVYSSVIAEIASNIKKGQIIISLAPGITIADLKKSFGDGTRVVRVMPNTPAALGEGMTGVCYNEAEFTDEETKLIDDIFSSVGRIVKVEEKLIDTVSVVSGSSPAFVYMFIDALSDAGVRYGLTKKAALEIAAQTVLGSAKMVLESGEHPAVLKDRVCSPGGTTIAGVAALEKAGFKSAVLEGCDAVYKKCTAVK